MTMVTRTLVPLLLLGLSAAAPTPGRAEGATEWPFCKPLPVEPPRVQRKDWIRNDIDTFILAKLEENGLSPSPEAPRRMLVRRLYFDLIGLPPTPEEIESFVNDADPKAYEKIVDRLLKDSRYGERWAKFWLDLARYADTAGYEGDPDLPWAWRYRDYVIDAFNNDKPYDVFVKEQIAGDESAEIMGAGDLPDVKPERLVALTFLRLAPFTEPRGDETRHEMLSEITATVGSVFLGLTVGCAKCHDHKYDRISLKDFYRMKAFFSTVQIPPPERGDIYQIGGPLPAEFYRPNEREWAEKQRSKYAAEIDESKKALEALSRKLTREGAELGAQESRDPDAGTKRSLKDAINDPRLFTQEEKERFLYHSAREHFGQQHLKRLRPLAMSLRHSYGPPYEPGVPTSRVMLRGEYDNPGEVVQAGFLSCITGHEEPAKIRLDPFKRWPTRSRRLALARWIVSRDHPLAARVMVNRLWHWHFGRGIVVTPSDFGKLSGGPSHRELLDWLASQFVEAKWSIKAVHRLMVTSSTYRQSSQSESARAQGLDPENKLHWRFRRRRLEAEAIRDSVLAVSGRLNREQFGLPIFPPLPGDIAERVKYSNSKWDTQHGPEGRKRSIYIYQQRSLTMPFQQTFDALVCDESRPRRRSSVTPLQALALYNGEFVNQEVKHFAERLRKEAGEDTGEQVQRAFQLALGRNPTAGEAARMEALMEPGDSPAKALQGLCRILYNSNEFVYID